MKPLLAIALVLLIIIVIIVAAYYYVGASIKYNASVDAGLADEKWYYVKFSTENIERFKKIKWSILYYSAVLKSKY